MILYYSVFSQKILNLIHFEIKTHFLQQKTITYFEKHCIMGGFAYQVIV